MGRHQRPGKAGSAVAAWLLRFMRCGSREWLASARRPASRRAPPVLGCTASCIA